MKKLLGCWVMLMIVFTACEGPMGPRGRDGIDGTNAEPTKWTIVPFRIQLHQWQLAGDPDELGSYYWCMYDVSEITEDIYHDGLVICSYLYVDSEGYDVQTILPYTGYFADDIGGGENLFAMHFSYSVTPTVGRNPGTIEFRITFSDFYTGAKGPPQTCNFKLTLVY